MKTILKTIVIIGTLLSLMNCSNITNNELNSIISNSNTSAKIGILLVNHGSRSQTWRNALLDMEKSVRDSLLTLQNVIDVRTAFMEYTEPSIATRLKQMDSMGITDVIIVPVFLTISPHTFEDIPTIVGLKEDPESKEMLKIEKIEMYKPNARVIITPLLDFTDILKKNVLTRVKLLSENPENEALVLIGYGDKKYLKEWEDLFTSIAEYIEDSLNIKNYEYAWCGHLVHYDPKKTTDAIQKALSKADKAIVIPVLVAYDEMFQIKIIGKGIENVPENTKRVKYKPDAILPDINIEHWIINISKEYVGKINEKKDNDILQ